ncbi:hypothetical protein [Pseudomonas fluorescens]|uniref:hypothetical protein n=1 Tax=Pseudomonas fluorescens TaxID=294 RepID=UPI0012D399B8|nr:hypothetical protein [Pseudomonas fluorescens]
MALTVVIPALHSHRAPVVVPEGLALLVVVDVIRKVHQVQLFLVGLLMDMEQVVVGLVV